MSVYSAYSDGKPFISFALRDPSGTIVLGIREDEPVYSASTIKLGVLLAAMEEVAGGSLELSTLLTASRTFPSRIPGAGTYDFDPEEVDDGMVPGAGIPLGQVLARMIEVSSNEATNMVADLVGLEAVNAAIRRAGASGSGMGRLFGDYAALDAGYTNVTTASDLTLIMRAASMGAGAAGETMRGYLRAQQYPVITAELAGIQDAVQEPGESTKLDWGSKSGAVTGIEHDVAFFRPARAPLAETYTLAVCTRGYPAAEAQEIIRAVTAAAIPRTRLAAVVRFTAGGRQ